MIHRSCSPTRGVCHNGKEYPDLSTFGNLLAAIDKPCNLDEVNEPEQIFDGCQPEADDLVITRSPQWTTKIAHWGPERQEVSADDLITFRRLVLADPAPETYDRIQSKVVRRGHTVVELLGYSRDGFSTDPGLLVTERGKREARIVDLEDLDDQAYRELRSVRGGDPNGNGVYGSESPWKLIAPGEPLRSYLVARITGTAPGSRMPLANAPITDPEYVAIFCWIETLALEPAATDPIDYQACQFAHDPRSF